MERTLFEQALRSGDLNGIKGAIFMHEDWLNEKDQRGFAPIVIAAYYDHKPIVEWLIDQGADIDAKDGSGNTALMGACFKGYHEIAALLLKKGASPNAVNFNGATALIYACTFNQPAIAQLLLEHGAEPDHEDLSGLTALDHARNQGLYWVDNLINRNEAA
mgnify:FL=1